MLIEAIGSVAVFTVLAVASRSARAQAKVAPAGGPRLRPVVVPPPRTSLPAAPSKQALAPASPVKLASPFPKVASPAWMRFVRILGGNPWDRISPSQNLGRFQLGYPRLADLGYVKNVRRVKMGKRPVWIGDFKPPLTQKLFLASPVTQYEAFVKATLADARAIGARHAGVIGKTIANEPVTLSGLLAVAHQVGLAGLDTWLSDAHYRRRFPQATALFTRATTLF